MMSSHCSLFSQPSHRRLHLGVEGAPAAFAAIAPQTVRACRRRCPGPHSGDNPAFDPAVADLPQFVLSYAIRARFAPRDRRPRGCRLPSPRIPTQPDPTPSAALSRPRSTLPTPAAAANGSVSNPTPATYEFHASTATSPGFLQKISISSTKPGALLHCDGAAKLKAYHCLTKVLVINTSRPMDEVNFKCEIGLSFQEAPARSRPSKHAHEENPNDRSGSNQPL